MQIKLDELSNAVNGANAALLDLEGIRREISGRHSRTLYPACRRARKGRGCEDSPSDEATRPPETRLEVRPLLLERKYSARATAGPTGRGPACARKRAQGSS